jgi:hypothetical protein
MYCDQVQQSDPDCSPAVNSPIQVTDEVQCVQSPGYPSGYTYGSSCNWHLKAPEGCSIVGNFTDTFGLPCSWNKACQQWVEIKYSTDLQLRGPRFCCTSPPTATLTSEGSEMVVTFRSDTLDNQDPQTGFKFCFKLASGCPAPTIPTTTATSTSPAVYTVLCYEWSEPTECQPFEAYPLDCGRSYQVRVCYLDLERTRCRWEKKATTCKRECEPCRQEGRRTVCDTCCKKPDIYYITRFRERSCSIQAPKGVRKYNIPYDITVLPPPTEITD